MRKRTKSIGTFLGRKVYSARQALENPELGQGYQLFRGQAVGAIPNGTKIEKCNRETDDSWPDGTQGVVVASMYMGDDWEEAELVSPYVYICHFDPLPEQPVLISGKRIRKA